MTSGNLNSADYPLLSHDHRHPTRRVQVKILLSRVSLCFLLLLLVSCGQAPARQSSNANLPKSVKEPSDSQITYVAIGASDTFGIARRARLTS